MSNAPNDYLKNCLYFTANSLSRAITRMAEEEFGHLGISPSHAFLIMIVIEEKVVTQKALSEHLNLAQSTVSRFVDAMVRKKYLEKELKGKETRVTATDKGKALLDQIHQSWKALYGRYSALLGEDEGKQLTYKTYQAFSKLNAEQ